MRIYVKLDSELNCSVFSDSGKDITAQITELSGSMAAGITIKIYEFVEYLQPQLVEKSIEKGGYIKLETGKGPRFSQDINRVMNGTSAPDITTYNDFDVEPELLSDYNYPPEVFEKNTGTEIDHFISWPEPGWPKSGQFVIAGEEGSGKTSNLINLMLQLKKANPHLKILFGSFEADPLKMQATVGRFYPDLYDKINMFFPQKYELAGVPVSIAYEKMLSHGWDYVITDSVRELFQIVGDELGLTGNKALNWYRNIMNRHNNAQNTAGRWTTFLNIQQLNNDGTTTGGARLRFLVDTVLYIKHAKDKPGQIYLVFAKNRFGRIRNYLHFTMGEGGIQYDVKEYENILALSKQLQKPTEQIDEDLDEFIDGLAEEEMKEQMKNNFV